MVWNFKFPGSGFCFRKSTIRGKEYLENQELFDEGGKQRIPWKLFLLYRLNVFRTEKQDRSNWIRWMVFFLVKFFRKFSNIKWNIWYIIYDMPIHCASKFRPNPDGESSLINSSLLFRIQNFLGFFDIYISHSEKVPAKIQNEEIAALGPHGQLVHKCRQHSCSFCSWFI